MPIPLSGELEPLGSFPILDDSYLRGGYMSVADVTARNNIPPSRRKEGMLVYLRDTNVTYRLGAGLLDADWEVANFGGGSGGGFDFILDTSATPSGNIYDDFATLMTAVTAATIGMGVADRVARIHIASSVNVSSGGPFEFDNVEIIGTNEGNTLTFSGTATAVGCPSVVRDVTIQNDTASAFFNGGIVPLKVSGSAHLFANTAPILDLDSYSPGYISFSEGSSCEVTGTSFGVFEATMATNLAIHYGSNQELSGYIVYGPVSLDLNIPIEPFNGITNAINTLVANITDLIIRRPNVITTSPALLGAVENDYNPTGFSYADVVRLQGDIGGSEITGFDSSTFSGEFAKKFKHIINWDAQTITFKSNDIGSAFGHRIKTIGDTDIVLAQDEMAILYFDSTIAANPFRVTKVGGSGGGGGGGGGLSFTSKKTASYSAAIGEYVLVDLLTAAANVTIDIPTAIGNTNSQVGVKIVGDALGYVVTISPAAGNIDAFASVTLDTDNEYVVMQSDGTDWWRIA